MSHKVKSRILVFIQFSSLGAIFISGSIIPENIFLQVLFVSGFILGVWAILAMRINNVSISPTVKSNAIFRTNGPYKVIRHPMYLALILVVAPIVITYTSNLRIFLSIVFLINMIVKLNYEEKLLSKHFPEYAEYQKSTSKLIPFIY